MVESPGIESMAPKKAVTSKVKVPMQSGENKYYKWTIPMRDQDFWQRS